MVQFPSGAHQSLLEISERDFCCMYYALAHPCNTFVQNAMEMGKIRTKEEYENAAIRSFSMAGMWALVQKYVSDLHLCLSTKTRLSMDRGINLSIVSIK